jgi:tetratricopeptide (TPR) repeat protein
VADLARGSVADRPWGRTFATLGLRGVTGQLAVASEGRRFLVAFEQGAVVAAWSPLASDAAVRVALTSHLVSSSQVPEIARRQAAVPDRDEVELIAELARLGPDHALRLRRRVIAQRAARTFSINHGTFVVSAERELAVLPGCELDVRAVVYLGARVNLPEARLVAELAQLGAWFKLKPGVDDDLPQFGFSDVEQPVVERLRDGGSLAEIEDFASSFVDGRTVRAVIYALVSCNACDLEPVVAAPRSRTPSRVVPSGFDATQPMPPIGDSTQPIAVIEASEPIAKAMTQPVRRISEPRPAVSAPSGASGASGASGPTGSSGASGPTGPTGSSGSIRLPSDEALREGSNPALRRPGDDSRRRPSTSPGLRRPLDRGDAGPGLVVRQAMPSRPPQNRQIAQVDTPQSHGVKALIAQRLKLLDQGADHFQLLGVAEDVPSDALRKAYFALARKLHPDRLAALGISDDGRHAQRLFAQINAGFAILSDQARRARYVDVLRRGGEAAIRAEQTRAEDLARRILEAEEAFRRGELAMRRDQPQAAVVELERAVQLNPDEADYHATLAWAKFCAAPDRPSAAGMTRTALDRAIQRSPRSINARFYLGRVERMLGRDQDALRHFRDVLAASPGHTEAAAEIRALEARLTGGDKPSGIFGRPPSRRS